MKHDFYLQSNESEFIEQDKILLKTFSGSYDSNLVFTESSNWANFRNGAFDSQGKKYIRNAKLDEDYNIRIGVKCPNDDKWFSSSLYELSYYFFDNDIDTSNVFDLFDAFKRGREEFLSSTRKSIEQIKWEMINLTRELGQMGVDVSETLRKEEHLIYTGEYEWDTERWEHVEIIKVADSHDIDLLKIADLKKQLLDKKVLLEAKEIQLNDDYEAIEKIESSKDMFREWMLKHRSKSKKLSVRLTVCGEVFDLKDKAGNHYIFKVKKEKLGKRKITKIVSPDFESKTIIDNRKNKRDVIQVSCVMGIPSITALERKKIDLAFYFGCDADDLIFSTEGNNVLLFMDGQSPSISSLPEKIDARAESFQKGYINLGYDKDNKPYYVGLYSLGHTLIGGMSGSGKSAFQNMLIGSLYNSIEMVEHLYLVDFKGGVEFWPYLKVKGGCQTVVSELEEFARLAEFLVNKMTERLSHMREHGITEYNGKAIFVLLDEYAIIENQKSVMPKELYNAIRDNVNKLMMQARASRIYLMFGVQKATDKELPTFIKDNAKSKFLFKVDASLTASNIMGSGWGTSGLNATSFPTGVFAHRADSGYKVLKSGFISDEARPSYIEWCSAQVAKTGRTGEHACEHRQD